MTAVAAYAVDLAFWLIVWADDLVDNTIDPTAHTSLNKVQVSAILIGVVLPLAVGLITRRWTSSNVKAVLLLAASALTAFITEWRDNGDFIWQQALLTLVLTFGTGVVTHMGFWRYNLAPKLQALNFGISGSTPPQPPPP